MNLKLDIVTPYGEIFNAFVKSVYVPGKEGEMGILSDHCDMFALLKAGVIDIRLDENKNDLVAINWGYVEIVKNQVSIIADGAVCIKNDSSKLQKIEEAKKLLKEASSDTLFLSSAFKKLEEVNGKY